MIRDFLNVEDEPVAETGAPIPQTESVETATAESEAVSVGESSVTETVSNAVESAPHCDLSLPDALPVGITYASFQTYRDIYLPTQALCNGTLFRELNYPFRRGMK